MSNQDFIQSGPALDNQYDADRALRSILKRRLPPEVFGQVEADLRRFGERVVTDIAALGELGEAQPPRLVPYDPWGRRIDRIETGSAWAALDRISAEEGIVAIGYERRHGVHSRLHQMAKLYLYHPSSAFYTCPLAMSDGAARAIEVHGDAELKAGAYRHLISRDASEFWTSGQWMTERAGGSDVGETATVARLENGEYRLYGVKWFTSATTSQMTMTLARPEGAPAGSRGLSLFYLELRDQQGALNGIRILRLKDKLGTRALPTAELELTGARARLVGGEGQGVKKIAALFNVTRVYTAVCAVGTMRRGVALARDFASRRRAFGKLLSEHPLHCETLASLQAEQEACLQLVLHVAELMGKEELGKASAEETAILRGLYPICKLYVARQSVGSASEVLESFGGAGYIEDTGLPRLLRDSQVFPIWEGTTNVLSLDLLRATEKEGALAPMLEATQARLKKVSRPELEGSVRRVSAVLEQIGAFLPAALQAGAEYPQAAARGFAFAVARTYVAALLLEHAEWSLTVEKDRRAALTATRYCAGEWASNAADWRARELRPGRLEEDRALGLDR